MQVVLRVEALIATALLLSCAESGIDSAGGGDPPIPVDPPPLTCVSDADCGGGLVCLSGACVSAEDQLPPEEEIEEGFRRPKAAGRYVFTLSAANDSVVIIDSETLQVATFVVADEPIDLAVVPSEARAFVLSRRGESLTRLDIGPDGVVATSIDTQRAFSRLALSPDARVALLYTGDGDLSDAGAEGLVGLIRLDSFDEPSASVFERAAGRRHTDIVFRTNTEGRAIDVAIIGKREVAFIDLDTFETSAVPLRRSIPDSHSDVVSREVVVANGGAFALIRSFDQADLVAIDVERRAVTRLSLPGIATDLDLSSDGSTVVAALRGTSQIVWFPLPGALTDPSVIRSLSVLDVRVGQVELAPDGRHAAIFTNGEPSEEFGWLDLESGSISVFDRIEKWVRAIGIGPNSRSAIILHRSNPDSTEPDLYERVVDQEQGYTVFDLDTGYAQLKRTGDVLPIEFVFAEDGRHAAVTLRQDAEARFRVDAIDLETLVTDSIDLASAPEAAGALISEQASAQDRVFVVQRHLAGRISFVDLQERQVRTVTGFALNSDID